MLWKRVRHRLAVQRPSWLAAAGLSSDTCALRRAHVSELHMHACCMPSRAARQHEMLMEGEASSAVHRAVASASLRDDRCQHHLHLVIARRMAQSDLPIWLAGDTPPARTERVIRSAPSWPHSPKVCACGDAKSLDGRHRVRRRGVSPTRSDAFRYLPSDPTVLGLRLLIDGR